MKKYYAIIISVITIDQITKLIVLKNMELYQSIEIIKDFFYITLIKNAGAAWGIFPGRQTFFYIITIICVSVLSIYLHKHYTVNKAQSLGIALFISGSIGNFIDRVRLKGVIDFFDFTIPIIKYQFPIFNIADISLVVGTVIILYSTLKEKKNENNS